jgi:hypothetical protein
MYTSTSLFTPKYLYSLIFTIGLVFTLLTLSRSQKWDNSTPIIQSHYIHSQKELSFSLEPINPFAAGIVHDTHSLYTFAVLTANQSALTFCSGNGLKQLINSIFSFKNFYSIVPEGP